MRRTILVMSSIILLLSFFAALSPAIAETKTFPDGTSAIYYAQNDPKWGNLIFQAKGSNSQSLFAWGGCNPTSLAMALANLIPERVCELANFSKSGFVVPDKMIWERGCHDELDNNDYLSCLPLVLGQFVCGNNLKGEASRGNGGVGEYYYKYICEIFNLKCKKTNDLGEMIEALNNGSAVVGFALKGYSPLTTTGHYVYIAKYDGTYIYTFDPLQREEYDLDKKGVIEQIMTGVLRSTVKDFEKLFITKFIVFSRAS